MHEVWVCSRHPPRPHLLIKALLHESCHSSFSAFPHESLLCNLMWVLQLMWTKCSCREGKGFAPVPSVRGGDVEADASTREVKRRFLGSYQCVWIPKCLRSRGTTPTVIWPDQNTALLTLGSGKLALTSGKSWFIWGIQPHFFWKRQIRWVIIGNSWTFSLQVMLSIFWR